MQKWNSFDVVVEVFYFTDLPKFTPASYLFFKADHLSTQINEAIYSFILSRGKKNAIIALFHCFKGSDQIWYSPPRAPFGGIATEQICTRDELDFFLACIEEWIQKKQGKQLVIKHAPSCYNPILSQQLHDTYISTGFLPIHTFLNHHIPVTSEDFNQNLHLSEKRRLKKSIQAGFGIHQNNSTENESIYPFLQSCLNQKGYCLSLCQAGLHTLLTRFPDDFPVFSATDGDNVIASIVAVRVARNILYVFISGYLPEYSSFSPIVLLTSEIYKFCQQNGISILDLGTSLDHFGKQKPGLLRFKKNLGGHVCTKVTYSKKFEKIYP